MRFGLIARADDRGLGIQTWEIARHLRPDRVLVVQMPADQEQLVQPDVTRFLDIVDQVAVVHAESMGDPSAVDPWLHGLDVVYSAETFYDWRFCDRARRLGVRTVLHCNPEFWKHWRPEHQGDPLPDVIWTPTDWQLDHPNMPKVDRVVPMPVPIDRWPEPRECESGPIRFLHINGHNAMADRNGTRALFMAMRRMTQPAVVTVTTQRQVLTAPGRLPRHVAYRRVLGNQADYWSLYPGHDVLVLPRRYGGLCLPANEAAGAGLALVLPDVSPNAHWPGPKIPTTGARQLDVPLGLIDCHEPDIAQLTATLDALAADPDLVRVTQQLSRDWAVKHSWDALEPLWREALLDAAR